MYGSSMVISGSGHANEYDGASKIARLEALLVDLGMTDRLDAYIGTVAVGHGPNELDRVGRSLN